jgi:predicted RNA binding protein YcfA (HicA-like mRNA interferase family)
MATKTEVETITRQRMVLRTDVAEYEQEGWKFVKNKGSQSALMEKVEKVKVPIVANQPTENKSKE